MGTADGVYPPAAAHRSAAALADAGHAVSLVEVRDHTNWLYDIGPWLSGQVWAFFRAA